MAKYNILFKLYGNISIEAETEEEAIDKFY